jgi:hypothetical protein
MKYLKSYENINEEEPQIDDYVIAIPINMIQNAEHFFNNTIGIISNITNNIHEKYIAVEYENIPPFISAYYCRWRERTDGTQYRENLIWFERNMIIYFSKNKEDIETHLTLNKYNI